MSLQMQCSLANTLIATVRDSEAENPHKLHLFLVHRNYERVCHSETLVIICNMHSETLAIICNMFAVVCYDLLENT